MKFFSFYRADSIFLKILFRITEKKKSSHLPCHLPPLPPLPPSGQGAAFRWGKKGGIPASAKWM